MMMTMKEAGTHGYGLAHSLPQLVDGLGESSFGLLSTQLHCKVP